MNILSQAREDWQLFREEQQVALWTTCVTVLLLIWLYAPVAIYICVGGIGYLAWRRWMLGAQCRSGSSLDGCTALVTGGNSGIGRALALELSKRGARIIIASRDEAKSRLAAAEIRCETAGEVVVKQLNLASFQSVRQLAKDVIASESRLDMLVNNAGIILVEPSTTDDGHDATMQVNYLGHWLLTHMLTDLLKSSAPARVINISSLAHWNTDFDVDHLESTLLMPSTVNDYSSFRRYGASKLAQMLHVRELSRRLRASGVASYSLHPGVVSTAISQPFRTNQWYWKYVQSFLFSFIFRNARMGAQTALYCALEPVLQPGGYYSDCALGWTSALARDDRLAMRVWEVTETALLHK